MKLKPIILGAIMTLSGCKEQVPQLTKSLELKSFADSICISTQKALSDTTLKCFFRDTVEISENDLNNPGFIQQMDYWAKYNIPKKLINTIESDDGFEFKTNYFDGGLTLTSKDSKMIKLQLSEYEKNSVRGVGEKVYSDGNKTMLVRGGYGQTINIDEQTLKKLGENIQLFVE